VLRQAVILAGGSRPRLDTRDQTAATPRSMLNVGGRLFLDTLIDEIVRYDAFEEILLLAGHVAEPIQARYAGTIRGRSRLTVALEQEPLGTAGALVRSLLQTRFLLLRGDSFFDFNFLDLVSHAGSSLVHMALPADVGDDRYRRVVDNNRVRAFLATGEGATGPVNGGVYVVDRSIVAGIGPLPASLEQDVLPVLAGTGTVSGTCYRGFSSTSASPRTLPAMRANWTNG
jgi:NDP-sugar pyrophosphorylase family protein